MDEPERAGELWDNEEQEALIDELAKFIIIQAAQHKRTEAAIASRIDKLFWTSRVAKRVRVLKSWEG